jgi:hypothetical protein
MMASTAVAHMTVTMAMSALHLHDGIVGNNRACGNARHRERCRGRGDYRHGDTACLNKSSH